MSSKFDSMILDLAGDDYTGLWKLVWGASADAPVRDPEELLRDIQREVKAADSER